MRKIKNLTSNQNSVNKGAIMKKLIICATLASSVVVIGCGKKVAGAKDAQSITSSITGNEKDVQEMQKSFKEVSAKLICGDLAPLLSQTPKFSSNSVDLTFKSSSSLEGKACSVEINGIPNSDKSIEWTSSEGTVGLLYVSTEAKVTSGKLNLNFYKTFQVVDSNLKNGGVTLHATFTSDIFADGVTEVKVQSAALKCDDSATFSADLTKDVVLKKETNLKADLTFNAMPVRAYKNCVASAIFDPGKIDVVAEAKDFSVKADARVEADVTFAKRAANDAEIKVEGSLGGQQKEQLFAKDLSAKAEAKKVFLVAKEYLEVKVSIEAPKAGSCELKEVRTSADKIEASSILEKIELKEKGVVERSGHFEIDVSDGKPAVKLAILAKCLLDKAWIKVAEVELSPKDSVKSVN